MAPKRSSASTKKLFLKNQSKPKHLSKDDTNKSIEMASQMSLGSQPVFNNLVSESSAEDLEVLDDYLRHGRANTSCKLECVAEHLSPVKRMKTLRDWLNEMIKQTNDQIHDQIIIQFGGSPDDFDFEEFKGFISKKVGEKSSMTDL